MLFYFILLLLLFFFLDHVADLVSCIHFCLLYFFYSGGSMVWSIIFYFCLLFIIFLFFFFPFIFIIYLSLLLIASLLVYILNQSLFVNLFSYNFKNIFSLHNNFYLLLLLIQLCFSSLTGKKIT